MKTLTDYQIILRPDDNGTYVAYVPAIKGCHAWGETPEEAHSEVTSSSTQSKIRVLASEPHD